MMWQKSTIPAPHLLHIPEQDVETCTRTVNSQCTFCFQESCDVKAPTDSEDEGAAPKAAAASSLPAETVPEPTAEELFAGIDTPQADDVDVDGALRSSTKLTQVMPCSVQYSVE
eukprot:923660-Amphidinium_carterae.1